MASGVTALVAVCSATMKAIGDDGAFMALVPGGAWDYVSDKPVWPYVCLESADEAEPPDGGDNYGGQGRVVTLTFAIFSKYQGRLEQFNILNELVRVLRHVRLNVVGWEYLQTWYDGARAVSPFEAGNLLAGQTTATFRVRVLGGGR